MERWRTLSRKARITGLFAGLLLLVVGLALYASMTLRDISTRAEHLGNRRLPLAVALSTLNNTLDEYRLAEGRLLAYGLINDYAGISEVETALTGISQRIASARAALRPLADDGATQADLAAFDQAWPQWRAHTRDLAEMLLRGEDKGPIDLFSHKEHAAFTATRAPVLTAIARAKTAGASSVTAALAAYARARIGTASVLVVMAVLIAVAGLSVVAGMARDAVRYQALLKTSVDGIHVINASGDLVEASDSFWRNLGYSPKTPPPLNAADWDPDYPAEKLFALERAAQGAPTLYRSRHRRADGSLMDVEVVARGMDMDNQRYLTISARDIGERLAAEAELQRYKTHLEEVVEQRTADLVVARNAAEAANRAKSVFLANMSHELRTPLNAILGFSALMRRDSGLSEEQRGTLSIINRSGEYLLKLINDVLDMAKIEAGQMQLAHAPFDLGGLVHDIMEMMRIRASEKGLTLLHDQSSEFPRYIVGDEARVRQILVNLIGNAIKFTEEGGVTVRLGTHQNAIAHLIIEVEDSGPGIGQEEQNAIFQPFVQLGDASDSRGTGLGLSITQQFVHLMQGRLSLESQPGRGTLFRVDLPLTAASESDVHRMVARDEGDVIGLAEGQPRRRILIVEDQTENQLLMKKVLAPLNYDLMVAENGKLAVELFDSWHPDLIFMDRRMPVMDGLESARQIRARPGGAAVKIVAVTASAFREQRDEMLGAGLDDFIRKPYRSREIYDSLTRQLGVEFRYAAPPADAAPDTAIALTPAQFAPVPAPLRAALAEALESLERPRIDEALHAISPHAPALCRHLGALVENFQYVVILRVLEEIAAKS